MLCLFLETKFKVARARASTNIEEVHVLVLVEVVGLKKFLGYVHDRGVNPDLSHYSELILNLTCCFNSTYSFWEILVS